MLEQLKQLWGTVSHRSFAIVLRSGYPLIHAWVLDSTDGNFETFNERVQWLIDPVELICTNGKRKKFSAARSEYGFCGKPNDCACHNDSITERATQGSVFGTNAFLEDRKITWTKKYGTDNPQKLKSYKDAAILRNTGKKYTNKEKDKINEKKIQTSLLRNGTEWPQQNPAIFRRTCNSAKKKKEYKFPSGRTVYVQGFENTALDILLTTYNENKIVVSTEGKIPVIKYIDTNGISHIFHPDIYIPDENLIIEVKSNWTYNKHGKDPVLEQKNLLKQRATIEAGYNFQFMIL